MKRRRSVTLPRKNVKTPTQVLQSARVAQPMGSIGASSILKVDSVILPAYDMLGKYDSTIENSEMKTSTQMRNIEF